MSVVLLVDDNLTIRNVIKIYLMGMDLAFLEADRAESALEQLKANKVDLIIADVNMPGMDGITFLRRVREDVRTQVKGLPVILLTADKSGDVRERGRLAGASHFIAKPVTSTELRGTVVQCLGLTLKK